MNMQEIETKTMSLLGIKEIRGTLETDEKKSLEILNKKYRDKKGKLMKGSFFINSKGEWEIAKDDVI